MISDYHAQVKCLQGAAGMLIAGENRYLSEPALYPFEFLIVLRTLQLLHMRMTDIDRRRIPKFMLDLMESLEQLTGLKSSFIFANHQEDIDLEGSNYPWRTGLVSLNTFRVNQVPLRRSNLIKFPRTTLQQTVIGVIEILEQYESLPLWETPSSEIASNPSFKQTLELAVNRRSVLLALLFSHLSYYHPKAVTFEDCASGLSNRLGVNIADMEYIRDHISAFCEDNTSGDPQGDYITHSKNVEHVLPAGENVVFFALTHRECGMMSAVFENDVLNIFLQTVFLVFHIAFVQVETSAIKVISVGANGKKVGFVCLEGNWLLWANATQHRDCLTSTEYLCSYFYDS